MDITLTMKQQKRIEIIERALRNELTAVEAAMVLGVSERQCYRVKARVRDQGVKGVLHGNRGRPCKYKLKDQTIKRVVEWTAPLQLESFHQKLRGRDQQFGLVAS